VWIAVAAVFIVVVILSAVISTCHNAGTANSGQNLPAMKANATETAAEENAVPATADGQTYGAAPMEAAPENRQKIDVAANGSDADIQLWEWREGEGWTMLYQTNGFIGKNGISDNRSQGDSTTPAGTFPIKFVFGLTQPDTKLDFRAVTRATVWVDDLNSIYYNTWQDTSVRQRNWKEQEDLYSQFTKGGMVHCIAIGFNGDCDSANSAERGRGAAIFICGRKSPRNPTTADVDVYESDMQIILSYLDKNANPIVYIHAE
jgi:L,D-peptidoglycan transpeptidase YkuD (ErfK/YbiS/YcfS/YnhG family)